MMEIITAVSKIALAFDFTFHDPQNNGEKFDNGYQDTFVLTLPDLLLKFDERKTS